MGDLEPLIPPAKPGGRPRIRSAPVILRGIVYLRERLRVRLGRDPQPNAGIIESQSVKTAGVGGERGYDGGKKVKTKAQR